MKAVAQLLSLLALGGCTKDSGSSHDEPGSAAVAPVKRPPPPPPPPPPPRPTPPPPRDERAHVPPNPPPVGSVAFVCSHSDEPFGNGSFMTMTVYDLERGTWTLDSATTPSTKERRVPAAPGDPVSSDTVTKHSMGKIASAKLGPLRAAAAKVLTGGPYDPEFPVPEGISCHVTLADAKGNAFFEIEKAHRDKKDAVNDLLTALFASSEQTGRLGR